RIGGLRLTADALRCRGLVISRAHDGELSVRLDGLELDGLELEVANLRIRATSARVVGRIVFEDGALAFEELAIDEAVVILDPLLSVPAPGTPPPAQPAARERPLNQDYDFAFLDRLAGQLDVDVVVDAKVPLIKRRVATHCFRVPIVEGTLNFKDLERDLSLLE